MRKGAGSEVISGTVNCGSVLLMRALRTGKDTTLAQIVRLVENAQARGVPCVSWKGGDMGGEEADAVWGGWGVGQLRCKPGHWRCSKGEQLRPATEPSSVLALPCALQMSKAPIQVRQQAAHSICPATAGSVG